jgi:hypothetical protein
VIRACLAPRSSVTIFGKLEPYHASFGGAPRGHTVRLANPIEQGQVGGESTLNRMPPLWGVIAGGCAAAGLLRLLGIDARNMSPLLSWWT